jgi:GGDEF domain-containing protein
MSRRFKPRSGAPTAAAGRAHPSFHGLSPRVQRLEALLAWSLACYMVWAAVFLLPPGYEVWAIALLTGILGAWARQSVARHPAMLLLRALLLLGGVFTLMVVPGPGPLGAWFICLLWLTIGYALLLPTIWASPLLLLSPLAFVLACISTGALRWQAATALGGALLLPWVAVVFGRTLRRAERQVEARRVDKRSQLYNGEGFFANGGELFDSCRNGRRPFSLVLLNGSDLRDAADLLGRRAADQLFAQMVRAIGAATPPGGVAGRTGGVEFALAMPGLTAERAEALVHQHLGRPPKVNIDLGGNKAVIVLDLVTALAPPEVHSIEELYDRLRAHLRQHGDAAHSSRGHPSTLQGLLMPELPLPASQRPTLPVPLRATD